MLTEEQLLHAFKQSLHEKLNNDDTFLRDIINQHFKKYCDNGIQHTTKESQPGLSSEKLNTVLEYIDDNIHLNISLKDLAKQVNLSNFHFSRLFKKKTNKTPLQYVNEKRIEIAKDFLLSEDKTITWISYELGYKNTSYFSCKFKEIVGYSPTEYRKNIRK